MIEKRLFVLAALAALAGCGGQDVPGNYRGGELPEGVEASSEAATMQVNQLAGTTWKLLAIDPPDRTVIFMDDPEKYLLQFKDETVMAARADCNACEGRYSSTGRALVVRIDCVTMGCPPGSHGELYLSAINTVSSFTLSGDGKELSVNFGAERGRLTFRRL